MKKSVIKLLSMVVFTYRHKIDDLFVEHCKAYAQFFMEVPELWMFVPCGEDGKVLEKPEDYNYFQTYTVGKLPVKKSEVWYSACHEYEKARDRVIFQDCSIEHNDDRYYTIYMIHGNGKYPILQYSKAYNRFLYSTNRGGEVSTIEQLVSLKMGLTEAGIKHIGLEDLEFVI